MKNKLMILSGIGVLSVGTYLMRLSGAKLGRRLVLPKHSQALLSDAATTLLFAVALATIFYENTHFAGMARVAGVMIGVFLYWRKFSLIVVIFATAIITALLRYMGIN